MEILNYDEQPAGGTCLAIFTVYIPAFRLNIHRVKLMASKKGHHYISLPAYSIEQPDGTKKWLPLFEFSAEKHKEFIAKVEEALKPFRKEI
jgi:hypothetical protein